MGNVLPLGVSLAAGTERRTLDCNEHLVSELKNLPGFLEPVADSYRQPHGIGLGCRVRHHPLDSIRWG